MFVLHQTVALTHDIPDAGLQLGDLGAVVAIHDPENVEVEFVAASGPHPIAFDAFKQQPPRDW